jgi:hypothetical protein
MNPDSVKPSIDKEPSWGWWMFGVGIMVCVALLGIAGLQYWIVKAWVPVTDGDVVTKFGISGDFFGFSNAVFSALAFAMIIVTLWMQKYELKQQRRELEQTQEIMRLQKEEMELQRQVMNDQQQEMKQQNDSLRRQRFESTFFGMLELHNQVVSSLVSPSGRRAGRSAFRMFLDSLREAADPKTPSDLRRSSKDVDLLPLYESWYVDNESAIGHYFRTLYNIMRYVDESGGREARTYSRLVRAQLSSDELELLLYNGVSQYGKAKFKPLIEKYSLLKHVRIISGNQNARDQYAPSAFGKSKEK